MHRAFGERHPKRRYQHEVIGTVDSRRVLEGVGAWASLCRYGRRKVLRARGEVAQSRARQILYIVLPLEPGPWLTGHLLYRLLHKW